MHPPSRKNQNALDKFFWGVYLLRPIMKQSHYFAGAMLVFSLLARPAFADDTALPFRSSMTPGGGSLFQKAQWEATLNNGVLFSPAIIGTATRPTVDYTYTGLQFARMLNTPSGDHWWRGNCELGGEVFGGGVFEGRDSYVAGSAFVFRYNFVQDGWKFVPYTQVDLGVVLTDVDRRLQGQNFNFTEGFALGGRYFIFPRWSLNAEMRFQHISNAGLSRKNLGVNALGPVIGLSYFF